VLRSAVNNVPDEGFITIAKVTKTQGRIGEVAAALLTDFPERFAQRKRLFALGAGKDNTRRELQVENHWFHKGQVVLKFVGVDSISQAEELLGCEIQVPLSERTALKGDAVYLSELRGCTLYDGGREIGKVEDVQFGSGEAPLLIVKGEKEFLVPFAAAFVENLRIQERRLEMKLPAGLLEVDSPLSREEKPARREENEAQRHRDEDRDRR
jgi:16S rRNA processing protein RimM